LYSLHQVIKRSLNSSENNLTTVAGTGCPGFSVNMLYFPCGIFIDIKFNLYVADSSNNRIQLFQSGQLNGATVAGKEAPGTIVLNSPTGVTLDAAGYLFVVDSSNHRIVGSGPNGFRCVAGCSGYGSSSNQLYYPQSMAFDSYGNIFVTDCYNNRIEEFVLATNLCSKCFNVSSFIMILSLIQHSSFQNIISVCVHDHM
jgi:DNA-binding beta-propeller fold protein YncE